MSVLALVPVSRLEGAKGRLAEVLSPAQRAELTLATLSTVLEAVTASGGAAIVLSADERVLEAVPEPHETRAEDPGLRGLNPQLEHAIEAITSQELLILHADLPLATGDDIVRLVEAAPLAPSVTLTESADGGTNAMLLRPPGRFPLAYGRDSARRHREAAEAAGMLVTTVDAPGLSLDLDTPADLEAFLRSERERTSAAGQLLRSWGFGEASPAG